jgi:hypothetical protein
MSKKVPKIGMLWEYTLRVDSLCFDRFFLGGISK